MGRITRTERLCCLVATLLNTDRPWSGPDLLHDGFFGTQYTGLPMIWQDIRRIRKGGIRVDTTDQGWTIDPSKYIVDIESLDHRGLRFARHLRTLRLLALGGKQPLRAHARATGIKRRTLYDRVGRLSLIGCYPWSPADYVEIRTGDKGLLVLNDLGLAGNLCLTQNAT